MSTEYVPYGDEWKKEMMKFTKSELIEFLKQSLKEGYKMKIQ